MILDEIAIVNHMTGAMTVRLRTYTGEHACVVASSVSGNGHMVNHRAPWIASHACNQMKIAKPFRFFTTYTIDAGEGKQLTAFFEMTFNWIGNIALCISGSRMVSPEEMATVLGNVPDAEQGATDAIQN